LLFDVPFFDPSAAWWIGNPDPAVEISIVNAKIERGAGGRSRPARGMPRAAGDVRNPALMI
jgi:hypothetical protein